MLGQHQFTALTGVVGLGQPEQAPRLGVQQHQVAGTIDRQHPAPHVGDQAAKELRRDRGGRHRWGFDRRHADPVTGKRRAPYGGLLERSKCLRLQNLDYRALELKLQNR